MCSESLKVAFKVGDRVGHGGIIVNAQATAHINGWKGDAFSFEGVLQFVDALAKMLEGRHGGNLASNVEMQAFKPDGGEGLGVPDGGHELLGSYAELVFTEPGSNLGMSVGIDIGIDAEGDVGHLTGGRSEFCYHV